MDPRFGILSHITLNRPKIYFVLKISSKAVMVHFVVVKSAGSSMLCKLVLNVLKGIYKKLCVVCLEIPFGEDSCRIEISQIDLQFGSV